MGPTGREGFGAVEAIVALALTALLLGLLVGTAAAGRRSLERVARAAERVESARLARTLVGRIMIEAAALEPVEGRDEVRVRLPIGWAEPCDSAFRWWGVRAPDPSRDSAVVLDRLARRRTVSVRAAPLRACEAGAGRTFLLDPPVEDPVLLRVFEAGVIRIDDAVRYGRWGTPRQPLSAASLDPSASGVQLVDGVLRVRISGAEGGEWVGDWWRE